MSVGLNVVVLIGLLSVLVVKGPGWYAEKTQNLFGVAEAENKSVADEVYYKGKESTYEAISDENEKNKIVFFGDSLTQNVDWDELFNDDSIINRGIGGDSTIGMLNRVDNIIYLEPKKLFIMAGINDLAVLGKPISDTLSNYKEILESITSKSPNTEVYIQSALPINNNINNLSLDPSAITEFNDGLKNLSEESNVKYIDIYSSFADKSGYLSKKYTSDGTHLNGDGYLVWKNQIKGFVNK